MNKTVLSALVCAAFLQGCTAPTVRVSAAAPKVILLIGDGMDDNQITIARDYLVGLDGRLALDRMPHRSAVQTQTVAEEDGRTPEYVPDSANTATSLATGIVTSAGRIGTTAVTDRDAPSIMELAQAAGYGTGVVTTASVTDATPGSFMAHVAHRLCEGPRTMVVQNAVFSGDCSADRKARGGRGSISEQIAASRMDIVLGGGMQHFDQPAEGEATRTVREQAVANGFRVIDSAADLGVLARGTRVLGLFSRGTMPVQWRGAGDAMAARIERVDGRVRLPEPFACEPNPGFAEMPRLRQMAAAALEHLDDGRGFVLMIESASVDKQSHMRRPCGQIGELAQLNETLELLLDYQRAHPETLILVTADHGQAAQLVPETSWLGGAASPGHFARLRTPEGGVIGVNYATNDSNQQEDHTGVSIPLLASGPGVKELPAFVAQREVFGIMLRHLELAAPPALD